MELKEETETEVNSKKVVKNKELIYSFTVFPDDLNYVGSLFGGKLLAEMDLAAANTARRILYGSDCDGVVTASLNKVDFKRPAYLGDIIEIKTRIMELGNSSIRVKVFVTKEDKEGIIDSICSAEFTMVAVISGKPARHNCTL